MVGRRKAHTGFEHPCKQSCFRFEGGTRVGTERAHLDGPRTIGAHDLDPLSESNPAGWFDVSRIVTLCSFCHGQTDGTKARHVTPQQPEPSSNPFIA
jgi:hypothetical protein